MNKRAQKQIAALCYLWLHFWNTCGACKGYTSCTFLMVSPCYKHQFNPPVNHQFNPSISSTGNMRSRSPWYFKAMHHLLLLPASLTGVMPECLPQGLPPFQLYVENHSKVLINFNWWLQSNLMCADGNQERSFSSLRFSIFYVYIRFTNRVAAYSEPGLDCAWVFSYCSHRSNLQSVNFQNQCTPVQ